jgi:hypothetical protein
VSAEVASVRLRLASDKLFDLSAAAEKEPYNRDLQAAVQTARRDVDDLLRVTTAANQQLKDLVGVAAKPDPALRAREDRGFVPGLRSVADIAAEEARRKAAEQAAAAQLKQQESYDKLRVSIEERISAGQLELEQGTALTEAQRLKIKLDGDLAAGLIKLTDPQKAVLNGKLSDLAASERQLIADKEAAKSAKALADARVEARRAEEKAIADFEKEQRDAAAAALASVDTRIKSLQAEAEASDLSRAMNISLAEAIELVGIERLKERQARYQEGSEPWLAVQREIEARQKLRGLIADRAVIDANQKAADEAARDWQRTADQIGQSLSDALMQGGKSAWEYIKGLFRSMVLRPVIQAIVKPVAGAFTSAMGFSGSASAATGGNRGGDISAVMNLLNGNTINAAVSERVIRAGDWLSTSSNDTLARFGDFVSRNSGTISNIAGAAGNAIAGYTAGTALKKAIGGKYEISKGYSKFQDIGMAVGSAVGGPVMGAIIGAVTGAMNRAFGRKPKEVRDSGIEGSLSGGAATGQSFQDWFQKGGWFRSNKSGTNFSALGDETSAALTAGAMGVLDSTRAWAQALKLPGDALSSVTTQFKIKLSGDATKDQAEIQALFGRYAADLATTFQGQLAPFQRAGEAISDTLQRLAGLQTFSEAINEFGGVFSRVANLSVDAREQLLGFAGGMEAFVAKTQSFAQNYYEEAELAGIQARQVRDQLAGMGINAQIFSRADFRRLVEGTDVSNEQGRQRLSQLLTLGEAFAPVGRFLESNGGSLSTLANMAPTTGVVQQILGGNSIEGLSSLTDATTAGTNATVSTLERLIARVGELEGALVKALDKSGRAVADSVYFDNGNRSWDELAVNGGGA